MRRPARIALRFIALTTLVIALAMVFAPSPASKSPYLSALSNVGLGTPALAGSCGTRCDSTTNTCAEAPGQHAKCVFVGSTCITKSPC